MEKFTLRDMVFGAIKQRITRVIRNSVGMPDVDYIIDKVYIGSYPAYNLNILGSKRGLIMMQEVISEGKALSILDLNIFVDFVKNSECDRVIVICKRGRARSAMVVLGYLMKYWKLSLDKAIYFLRYRRPIYLNKKQYERMKEYEKWIKEKY